MLKGTVKWTAEFLNRLEEWTLVFILLGLGLLSFVQVCCRYLLGFSFIWMEELNRYLGVLIAFLGAAIGVKYGTHFSMDLIYEKVSTDRFKHGLKTAVNVACAIMFVIVAYYGWTQAMKLRQFGVRTSVLLVPKYWAYLPIPFFSAIMSFRFFGLAGKHFQAMLKRQPFRRT
jgi:C4-dicarboxylate transporter, DctQ subunit